jgi:hypothetical protein
MESLKQWLEETLLKLLEESLTITASRSCYHGTSQQAQNPKEVRWPKEERRREALC